MIVTANLLRNERGSSIIEMALAAPFLAALLIGMVDLSRGYSAKLQLEQAAQRTIEKIVQQKSVVTDYTAHKAEAAMAAGVTVDAVTIDAWLECSADGQTWRRAASFSSVCETSEPYYARYVEVDITKIYNPLFGTTYAGANTDGTYTLRGIAGVRIQ
ncbi:MAG: pilus assembly protein [Sphingomonas sp.]|nr:pilus assembly protein [Sphingomonas sp.]